MLPMGFNFALKRLTAVPLEHITYKIGWLPIKRYPHQLSCKTAATRESPLTQSPRTRYPEAPRVGVGVIMLRRLGEVAEVLLIRRGREPQKGLLSFPGGSVEIGESMVDCAVREALEETGLHLRRQLPESQLPIRSLAMPRPADAVDAIHYDAQGRVEYHYTIVDLAAVPEDPLATPKAGDDADEVIWAPVASLKAMTDLVKDCARIAEEATQRFDIPVCRP